jgi:hypothetical protein
MQNLQIQVNTNLRRPPPVANGNIFILRTSGLSAQ